MERFWPLSTKERPKQLLSLFSSKSMIRETVDRVLNYVEPKNIYVATNQIQAKSIISDLNDIPKRNIIIEPAFKDTAAAIAYGSLIISRDSDKDEVIAVLASDHLIADLDGFIQSLKIAEVTASEGYVVTLGIKPSRPETGYGYIQLNNLKLNQPSKAIRFMEKPNLETAIEYLEQGNYVWNSGMFIFKYSTIINELNRYIPNHVAVINDMKKVIGEKVGLDLSNVTRPYFDRFERISIDFAVMEKSQIIQCIPVDFGWNDVGGFKSLEEVFEKDNNNNIIKDVKYIQVDSTNNIVISDRKSRLITSIGVSNMVIVDTKDALLICNKDDSQRIKELLKKLS
ncbi:MAG: sugar phosphate nucleotidyltransferase [Acholeplasmataceae bacterium]|nr:sugar phosphate nucleotidyltransferase [Acholeplasmataceae bacterium]